MGRSIDGVWHDDSSDRHTRDGRFVRRDSQFRNWVSLDGAPGPSGEGGFQAEPGRYHLYVSLACPWAHRTLILRKLKRLEEAVSVSVVHWHTGREPRTEGRRPRRLPQRMARLLRLLRNTVHAPRP